MHGQLNGFEIPEGDVLCIAGDISPLKIQKNMPEMISWLRKTFIRWVEDLPVEKVFLVAGNHDFIFENGDYKAEAIASLNILNSRITYLENASCMYDGKLFYGSPYVIGPAGWAFYDSTKKLDIIDETMPRGVDVAIFHQPLEYGGNGRVFQVPDWMIGNTIPSHLLLTPEYLHPSYGSVALDNIVEMKKPRLVLTGHVHSGNHNISNLFDTQIANVSVLDEDYKLKYNPFVIDLA